MSNILQFRLKKRANRNQAWRWLINNFSEFPLSVDGLIGDDLFHGWRFIQAADGVVYFSDCISKGITIDDFHNFAKVGNHV